MKRMFHPKHGYHNASNLHEEAALKASGWVEDDGNALAAKLKPAVESAPEPEKRGPGRPRKQ